MNKWMSRAVGTVGVAGGMLLLGAGVAHADDSVTPGALDELSGSNLGATLDTPGSEMSAGMVDNGPLALQKNNGELGTTLHTPGANGESRDVFVGGRAPDALGAVPGNDLMPNGLRSWGLSQSSLLPGTAASTPRTAASTQGTGAERTPVQQGQSAPVIPVMGTLSQLPLSSLPVPGLGTSPLGALTGTTGNLSGADGATGRLSGATGSGLSGTTGRSGGTEGVPSMAGLPSVGGVPFVDSSLPVLTGQGLPPVPTSPMRGNIKPVNDVTVPLGESTTESAPDLAALQYVPFVGNVLQNNKVSGVPSLDESYLPRHAAAASPRHAAAEEALPVVGGLPLVGSLPLIGSLL
jgi:hypothetical protein